MIGRDNFRHGRNRILLWAGILASLPFGCTTTPGRPLGFGPEPNKLIDSAKAVRQQAYPAAPVPRELNKLVLPPYVVEPGDVLLVQPTDLESTVRLPGDQTVLPDGTIDLGKYGRIVVAGRRVEEIESMARSLVQAQVKDAGPINARVVSRVSKVYYVLGEVNAPGSFPVQGRETVLDAIVAAGGLNSKASRENIVLSRPSAPDGCRTVLPVCYQQIVQLGDTTTNYQVLPGDRIYVPARSCEENGLFGLGKKKCPVCEGPQAACPTPAGAAPSAPIDLPNPAFLSELPAVKR